MNITFWIPSFVTSALLGLALWLFRNLIKTRLTESVRHEFNTQLESLRTELRKNEEIFKADLRSKEAEIVTLRSGAITAMASRQVALDKRRLEAVDQLWSAFTTLESGKGLVMSMSIVKFEETAKMAVKDPRVRDLFKITGGGFDFSKINLSDAAKSHPFVSPMAWALFSAYKTIIALAEIKLKIITIGADLDPTKLIDREAVSKLVKAALPHRGEYIDRVGDAGHYYLLEEIEQLLLNELQKTLAGVEADKTSVVQAAEIVKLANAITESSEKSMLSAASLKVEGPEVLRS